MAALTRILAVPNRYRRMTARELSAALDRLGLSARQLARGVGTQPKRVIQQLAGTEDIPHSTFVIVRMMEEVEGGKDLVKELADEMILEEEPAEPGEDER